MASPFTFYDYLDEQGVNVIFHWLHGDGAASRAYFDHMIANLAAAPPGSSLWAPPYCGPMKGKAWKDIFEIRKRGSIQFRLFICYGPGDRQVTILAGGSHKNKIYTPHNVANLAQARKALLFATPDEHREVHRRD